jgi:probable F420-dependent oxidoreductase
VLVDAMLSGPGLSELADQAQAFERWGYAGVWSSEVAHEPFMQLLIAAQAAPEVQVGTAISVAFARTPMSTAYAAADLQRYSGGRFALGLGSQVKAHVERRFSMPWSHPAPRMREYISALRAIWEAWATGAQLDFRGDFYTHTLMTPFFTPPMGEHGAPPIYLAAVGELMTQVAGEVADGLLVHPFTTPAYLTERTLPAIERALVRSGRTREQFAICVNAMVVTGRTEEEMRVADDGVRAQLAFYGSTPAYRGVLEQHGWGELGDELNRLSRTTDDARWQQMKELIDDEVLRTFAIVAAPEQLGAAILERFGAVADRLQFGTPYKHDRALLQPAVEALQATGGAR